MFSSDRVLAGLLGQWHLSRYRWLEFHTCALMNAYACLFLSGGAGRGGDSAYCIGPFLRGASHFRFRTCASTHDCFFSFCQVRREGKTGTPRRSGPCTCRSVVYKYRGRIVVRTVASALRSEVRPRQQKLEVSFYLIGSRALCSASVFFQDVFAARQRRYVLKADRLIFEHVRVGGG